MVYSASEHTILHKRRIEIMYKYLPITDVYAREILDSRGNPTIEVEVLAGDEFCGRASVPSGASTGKYEALELRDKEERYGGLGVQQAADHVNARIAPEVIGMNVLDQAAVDQTMIRLDGTKNKSNLGANAMLGVSLATARAAAGALGLPLYSYLGGTNVKKLPVPMMNIMNGGRHADNTIDIQEFMIMPVGAGNFKNGLQMCAEVYHELKQLLKQLEYSTAVGDEGGFAPDLHNADEVLRLMVKAVEKAGYQPGKEVAIALDVAASELYDKNFKKYVFDGDAKKKGYKIVRSAEELIDYYEEMIEKYPVVSIEDPLDEDDWEGWKTLTDRLGERVQFVEQSIPMAASVATEDTLKFTDFHSMGATYAAYLKAVNRKNQQAKEGWVSCGSFLFPYKALRLDSLTSLVMPEREPQRFASEVKVYTQEGTITESTIEVNRPMEIAGWKIYQLSYDESKGRWSDISVFELVRDPWLPVVYAGIIMMMLGAICLFVNAQKRKEEDKE